MSESSHGSRASGRARFRRTFRSRGIAVVNRGNWSRISVVSIVSVRAQRELVRINAQFLKATLAFDMKRCNSSKGVGQKESAGIWREPSAAAEGHISREECGLKGAARNASGAGGTHDKKKSRSRRRGIDPSIVGRFEISVRADKWSSKCSQRARLRILRRLLKARWRVDEKQIDSARDGSSRPSVRQGCPSRPADSSSDNLISLQSAEIALALATFGRLRAQLWAEAGYGGKKWKKILEVSSDGSVRIGEGELDLLDLGVNLRDASAGWKTLQATTTLMMNGRRKIGACDDSRACHDSVLIAAWLSETTEQSASGIPPGTQFRRGAWVCAQTRATSNLSGELGPLNEEGRRKESLISIILPTAEPNLNCVTPRNKMLLKMLPDQLVKSSFTVP
ncbi:hypothetical protein C8F04DRAFT_1243370 [Mycena alexandri]|uniref:Uncharacterized protein n=1 Tax=Mycena alexandri TaxID=1745969 RepID=A0AAD6RZE7_9AGAR|nr:hypothetical protein C8F04DRAFT_1243370 [Mycena alexandri]